MIENRYKPIFPTADQELSKIIGDVGLASVIGLTMFGIVELTDSSFVGRDISIRENSVEHGTYSKDSSYFAALIELANAERELTETLAAEYKFLLENQTDGDPEIDAIISKNLTKLL